MRVMIVVTHLLGTGHLARALTLARAFLAENHEVIVVSGGMSVPLLDRGDVPLVQLPPLRSDGTNFARLLDEMGNEATAAIYEARTAALGRSLTEFTPHALVTELFPFGRRNLREEFTSLLETAQTSQEKPQIFASIRDILAPPSKPAKAQATDDLIAKYYDAVLVHADPALIPLSVSWPVSDALAPYLRYTGFVAPAAAGPHPERLGQGEILVSAGGGDVGAHIFAAALEAARLDTELQWRLLVGGKDAAPKAAAINDTSPENLRAESARPDFRNMLNHTAASVSMCGYNTALDILQAGTPAIFVPFDAGGEVEQGLRATALAKQDGIGILQSADLTARSLVAQVRQIMQAPKRTARTQGFDGASETVRIVAEMVEEAA